MTKILDLVEIKKDSFFNGAVQAEWFYDEEKRKKVSESYIFHGPKYYGVSKTDINDSNYKLYDTATFAKIIYDKIYNDYESNRFALTIAGYGAGKSHLSLTLATLLSGVDKNVQNKVIENIMTADKDIGGEIDAYRNDNHFVIVLNGINDFNLNREVLRVAKQTLSMYGLGSSIFDDMTVAFKTAKTYLEKSYDYLESQYVLQSKQYSKYKALTGKSLKEKLLENIDTDYDSYNIVNKVYSQQTGNDIRMDEGISAGTVLQKIHQRYVVEEELFKSVVIFFDEFGRYLEFASAQPGIAGETGIQQIFEAVQNAAPSMFFIGFIQSDLSAYIARVNNDNIVRYVGRYQNSDKYYLSSNLETVLASLIKKKNSNSEAIISNIFDNSLVKYSNRIFNNLTRWIPELIGKSVWSNQFMFNQTILKGCYPIHPFTTSLLCSLSNYMQQRSTFSFLSDIFINYKNDEISDDIPFIYPAALIKSPIFNELLNAEERGRTSGQNCLQFRELLESNEENLNEVDKEVLRTILITNILKFRTYDLNDALTSIEMMLPYESKTISSSIEKLDKNLGLIYFDDSKNRYIFMAEGNSKVDFNREFIKKKLKVNKLDFLLGMTDDIKKELKLDLVEPTAFGILNNISTNEWAFTREFLEISEFSRETAMNIKYNCEKCNHPDTPRAKIIYLYCDKNGFSMIPEISLYLKELEYNKLPILIGIINDSNEVIKENLIELRTLNSFNEQEIQNFSKFFDQKKASVIKKIVRSFMELAQKRQYVDESGLIILRQPLQKEFTEKLSTIFNKTIPFTMDGFEKKLTPKTKKNYNAVIECLLTGKVEDEIEFNNLQSEIKNRVNSLLDVKYDSSWKVLYKGNVLDTPQNRNVAEVYEEILGNIKSKNLVNINSLLGKYMKAPYGVNIYAASLMIIYVLVLNKKNIKLYKSGVPKRVVDIIEYFNNDKKEQFTDFFKLEIAYIEETDNEKIEALISKIEKNRTVSIDNAVQLNEELKKIQDVDISHDLRGRYYNCKETLNIACNRFDEIERNLLNAIKETEEKLPSNPFYIRQILSVLIPIKDDTIEGLSYRYSISQVERAQEAKKVAIEKCKTVLARFGSTAPIDKFETFKSLFANTIKQLPSMGEVALVNDIKAVYAIYENRYKENQRVSEIANKINDELTTIKIGLSTAENLEKVESLIIKWTADSEKLSSYKNEKINSLLNDLTYAKSEINSIKEAGQKILQQISEKISNINTIKDLNDLKDYILRNLNIKMQTEHRNKLWELHELIDPIIKELEHFKIQILKVTIMEEKLNIIIETYCHNNVMKEMVCRIKSSLINRINSLEHEWMSKYLISDSTIELLSIKELREWKEKSLRNVDYLSEHAIKQHEVVAKKIDKRLNKFKIEHIYEIFNELSIDDKKQCLDILGQSIL